MNNLLKTVLTSMVILAMSTTVVSAEAKKGQKYYLKKLKVCKKDGLKNGAVFATKHTRKEWSKIKENGALLDEFKSICPSGTKKIDKMRDKDVKNLYDFIWKFAADGEVPSCG